MADEIALIDLQDPRSFISLVPPKFQQAILGLSQTHPHWIGLSEGPLREAIGEHTKIPASINTMRIRIWSEFHHCQMRGLTKIDTSALYAGYKNAMFYRALEVPHYVAWLLCPPEAYEDSLNEALQKSMVELRAILEMPSYDAKGRPDKTVIDAKLKVYALLDARKHGSFVQRIQQQNLNVTMDAKDTQKTLEQMTSDEIEKKIAALKKKQIKEAAIKEAQLVEPSDSGSD